MSEGDRVSVDRKALDAVFAALDLLTIEPPIDPQQVKNLNAAIINLKLRGVDAIS